MPNISIENFRDLFLSGTPLMDVRAPVEFVQGSLPGAVNLPIMDDQERALVGTAYKKEGREKAIGLGHELVSGSTKEARIEAWQKQIRQHPDTVIYCFRGGLRSQIAQRWLREAGVERPLIVGGYKKARQFLIDEADQFAKSTSCLMLSGTTGSAKTRILREASGYYPAVDLEALAHHRGSAFGAWDIPQPSQRDFESRLAVALMRAHPPANIIRPVLIEDESRMIGQRTVPESLFITMRASPVIFVDESFEQRVENIFQDYVMSTALARDSEEEALVVFTRYLDAVAAISRKLGGVRTQEVLQYMSIAQEDYRGGRGLNANKEWIRKLLHYYYDPLYAKSLTIRQPKVVFRGSALEVLDYLKSL